jgi:hypothetical protein
MIRSTRSQSDQFVPAGADLPRHMRLEVRPNGQPEPS